MTGSPRSATGSPRLGLDRRDRGRVLVAVGVGLAGEFAALGLLTTGAWLLLSASLRPPILLLSIAIGAVQLFSFLRGTARFVERLASHSLGLSLQAELRAWLYRRLAQLVPCGLPGGDRGDLLTRLIRDTEEAQDLVVRAAVRSWPPRPPGPPPSSPPSPCYPRPAGPSWPPGSRGGGHRRREDPRRPDGGRASGCTRCRRLLGPRHHHRPGGTGRPRGRGMGPGPTRRARVGPRRSHQSRRRRCRAGPRRVRARRESRAGRGGLDRRGGASSRADRPRRVRRPGLLGAGRRRPVPGPARRRRPPARQSGLPDPPGQPRLPASPRPRTARGRSRPQPRPAPGARRTATVALRGATAAYPNRPGPVLRDLDLELAPGRPVALAGPSGSGKTLAVLTLLRFFDLTAGNLSIDGTDARACSPGEVRALLAWSPEQPTLFPTSLRVNLRVGAPHATDRQITDLLRQLRLGPWLDRLEQGLDTVLAPWDHPVSGGELQRLSVARAVLADRPVLLLDEPTRHLDAATADAVLHAVLERAADRSLLWITHRWEELAAFPEVHHLGADP